LSKLLTAAVITLVPDISRDRAGFAAAASGFDFFLKSKSLIKGQGKLHLFL
jgi:hypothetical protein